ncbi:hypothetical protein BELL_0935g00020 [Botrytis elliptica]|uniref:Uncharacterized protein n=1 Tax=Botrytis elliptica TaxID=278938 RepID=A0A4Z1IZF1_9HELO|nr:hypothetical protein BELL_0935g00020 [Botrytis elliptica]
MTVKFDDDMLCDQMTDAGGTSATGGDCDRPGLCLSMEQASRTWSGRRDTRLLRRPHYSPDTNSSPTKVI